MFSHIFGDTFCRPWPNAPANTKLTISDQLYTPCEQFIIILAITTKSTDNNIDWMMTWLLNFSMICRLVFINGTTIRKHSCECGYRNVVFWLSIGLIGWFDMHRSKSSEQLESKNLHEWIGSVHDKLEAVHKWSHAIFDPLSPLRHIQICWNRHVFPVRERDVIHEWPLAYLSSRSERLRIRAKSNLLLMKIGDYIGQNNIFMNSEWSLSF